MQALPIITTSRTQVVLPAQVIDQRCNRMACPAIRSSLGHLCELLKIVDIRSLAVTTTSSMCTVDVISEVRSQVAAGPLERQRQIQC